MKKFILKLIFFCSIQAGIAILIWSHYVSDPNHFLKANTLKHNRLDSLKGKKKIIIVGGSSAAFGFDCAMIKAAFPDYEPVNMGLHAGIDGRFLMWEVEPYLEKGDILLCAFEFGYFETMTGSDITLGVLRQRQKNITYLRPEVYPAILDNLHAFLGHMTRSGLRGLKGKKPKRENKPYTLDSFNKYGDVFIHLEMESKDDFNVGHPVPNYERNLRFTSVLNSSYRRFSGKEVSFLLTYQPFLKECYDKYSDDIDEIHTNIKRTLKFEVLGSPSKTAFPKNYFFDSPDHLNKVGRPQRTQVVIDMLKQYFSK